MANRYELVTEIYNKASKDIVSSPEKWQRFLSTACYNYRLRFDEQVLLFAQRPDATAVLEIYKWNNRFLRWVNRGANSIAVFEDINGKSHRLRYFFDISDTHETKAAKPVPIWQYKDEYQFAVIETLENTFGTLENKDNIVSAVFSAAENAAQDNTPDYIADLTHLTQDSFLEELDEDMISAMYRKTVQNSIAFMMLTRLGFDAKEYFDTNDFQPIVNFNTPETLTSIGFATSDIAEMALLEIARTVRSLDMENRIFAKNPQLDYTKTENKKTERSVNNDADRLHESRQLQYTEYRNAASEEFDFEQIWADEEELPQGTAQDDLLQPDDAVQARQSSEGDRRESESNGIEADGADVGTGRLDRGTESSRPNGLGTENEQSEKSSSGNRDERGSLQSVTDNEIPPFVDNDLILALVKNPNNNLTHRKEFIIKQFAELADKQKSNYVPILYGGKWEEIEINGKTVGYKEEKDGLLMYEGNYKNRTRESVFSWDLVAELIQQLIDNGEYLPTTKAEPSRSPQELHSNNGILARPLKQLETDYSNKAEPSQFSLFDFNETFINEPDVTADSQVSLFTDFGVSQQIIEEALCSGANEKDSRIVICAYFRRDYELENNVKFLKEHYGQGAFGFLFEGEQVSVFYDEKGIRISKGNYANRSGATLVTWEQAAKRVRELLDIGRYMPQSELEKVDDFEISFVADRIVEFSRNMQEDYANKENILPFVKHHIKNLVGYPDMKEKVKELLKNPADFKRIADEYADFMQALENDGYFLRFHYGREYTPEYVNIFVEGMQREPIPFKAQPDFATPSEYFISEDEIKTIIRGGKRKYDSENRLERYSYYLEHPNAKERVKMLKDKAGWSGVSDSFNDYRQDSKGFTFSHNDVFRPYAKTTVTWQQVDKYISNMIASHEYLSQADLKLVDYYERKQAALAIHHFYFGVPNDVPKLNNYKDDEYWESVENITEQLSNPDRVSEIQSIMTELYNTVDFEDRYKEYAEVGIKTINKFANGNFTCFGDKSKTIEPLIKTETPVEKEQAEPVHNTQELQSDNSISARQKDLNNDEPEIITPAPKAELKPKVQTFDLHPEIPMSDRHNYNYVEKEIETVGKKERFRRNIDAINVLKECEFENRFATPEEQEILSGYVGWGGIPEAFDENNEAWKDEFIELYTVLSPNEYKSAKASTLTAFYTPQTVISAIYKALDNLGFKQGNILEPSCAIGNFIGMLPEKMKDSKMYGIEIDTISAGIAQQLYQKSSIMEQPFEKAELPDSFFDAVVGNVPFGDYKLNDKRYDKHHFLIHDYFFAKSLDKVRPGGILCLVTSKGTMDKENSNVRRYIAQRAELLGAVRLPNSTFKGNAGTKATSDILILKKRDRIVDIEPEWVQLDTDENGIRMNKYFVQHPEMIVGKMVMQSGRFEPESACVLPDGESFEELLGKAVSNIQGEITDYTLDDSYEEDEYNYIPADPNVRNFSYTVADGKIYIRENSVMREVETSETGQNRIKGMIAIRDSVRKLLDLQMNNYPDEEVKAEQDNLNAVYDKFAAKYGYINSRANASAFSEDSSYFLICSLEIFEEGKFKRKADMFTKRTIQPHTAKTHADTAIEAYGISIGEKAKIDMPYMCQLTGKDEEQLFEDLKRIIFLNPDYSENGNIPKYLPADEYLSGNVRIKLRQAKDLAEKDKRFAVNVDALEKVQPVDLKPNDIIVHLGATWFPVDVINEFMHETFDTPYHIRYKIRAHYNELANVWNIANKAADNTNLNVTQKYGTHRKNAFHILEATLNLRNVRVFDYIEDENGKRVAVLNKKETAIAQSKQEMIKQSFQDWIWRDPERRDYLCKLYNEKFNSTRPREYDGSHIVFEGMNPEIALRTNQINAAARGIYGGNTLLAHCVGGGKTYTMAAIAQESKRLGLCTKSLFVVPNHLVSQWASEYLTLYPSANILVATEKDFETKNRKKFCARIATGDYDAIIIGHSQFEKIPISIGRQIFFIQEQIDEILQSISDLKASKGEKITVKQLEGTKKKLEAKLERLNDQNGKDDVVTFEELGVDRLFVDEAHSYKNLFVYSKMKNVGGISQVESYKSSDMFMKCRYLDELTGSKGITFATGTPISNSMVELYTMQRYLQYDLLREYGYLNFDSWAAQYGETVTAIELTPEGTGYRSKVRFARFNNLPELMAIFKECADIQTADMLKLPVPKAVYKNISVKPSEIQVEMVEELGERAEKIRDGAVKPYEDNMLIITNDGRKLALDQRLLNSALPDFEGSKVNECIRNVFDIWENTAEKKSTQLIFCDLSTPNKNTIKTDNADLARMIVFQNIYDDIRKKLIEKGIPPEEIAFIHDAANDKQKAELFAKVRTGSVRVLLGSTEKMGAGTNVQNRLIAIHNVDCPWRPSDLEQRAGRIIRQGNENDEVYVYRYVTENTFDAYLYQLVETKQKFIGQVMTSKTPMRSIEDVDEAALSYAEIKMLATGNPHIKEKMDLDIQVQNLKMLQSNFYAERYALEDKVVKDYPQDIARYKSQIKALKVDIETAKQYPKSSADYFGGMVINDELYTEKKAAGEAIIGIMKSFRKTDDILPVGKYRGFDMEMFITTGLRVDYILTLKGAMTHRLNLGTDALGNITRIDNCIDHFAGDLEKANNNLAETEKQLATAQESLKEPFSRQQELQEKQARLNELNALLNFDDKDDEFIDEEPDESEVIRNREKVLER